MQEKAINQVKKFLDKWKAKDFQGMYNESQGSWQSENKLEDVKMLFSDLKLKSYKIIDTRKLGDALIGVAVEMSINGETAVSNANVIFEKGVYNAHPDGEPGVNPISVLRYSFIEKKEETSTESKKEE